MARKKYEEESNNNERWLITNADFITLLLALSAVLYALSSLTVGMYRVLSSALGNAVSNKALSDQNVRIAPVSQSSIRPLQLSHQILRNTDEFRR